MEAPQNVTVLNVTESRSVILSWEPVSIESIRGNFTGYKVSTFTMFDINSVNLVYAYKTNVICNLDTTLDGNGRKKSHNRRTS